MNIRWLSIASGILLLLGIPYGWPYSYYIFLRWFVCVAAIIAVIGFGKSKLTGWALAFGAIAFLFNPLFPVSLNKNAWVGIDLVSAVLFFISAYSIKERKS